MEREEKKGAEMASANPKDLVKEFKTSRAGDVMTLLVKPEFVPAWTSDDDQPYRVYDKSFSRLVVTILWKSQSGAKMSVTGNTARSTHLCRQLHSSGLPGPFRT